MVIFGKKAKALLKRVEELEDYVKRFKEAQDEHFETLFAIKRELNERLNKEEAALKELTLTVENGFEDGNPKKTPQQLLREWFLGEEDGK